MASSNNIGNRRLVVGAHYGVKDFLAQRVTAIILAVYTIIFAVMALLAPSFTYETWVHMFNFRWGGVPAGQMLATLAVLATAYHAWIGVRDIWMDYVRPAGLRLLLQVLTILWLLGAVVYAANILWSL